MEAYKHLDELMQRYPQLEELRPQIQSAYEILRDCYTGGGKLLIAGNGGSCADAEHMVGELMKGFVKTRKIPADFGQALETVNPEKGKALAESLQGAMPAIALHGHPGLSTAFSNDVDPEMVYAQQTYGYGEPGDVFLGISTSGNAKNIEYAAITAKAKGMKVLGLTGKDGGKLGQLADVAMIIKDTETYRIQELHLPVYHTLCLMLEETFF